MFALDHVRITRTFSRSLGIFPWIQKNGRPHYGFLHARIGRGHRHEDAFQFHFREKNLLGCFGKSREDRQKERGFHRFVAPIETRRTESGLQWVILQISYSSVVSLECAKESNQWEIVCSFRVRGWKSSLSVGHLLLRIRVEFDVYVVHANGACE